MAAGQQQRQLRRTRRRGLIGGLDFTRLVCLFGSFFFALQLLRALAFYVNCKYCACAVVRVSIFVLLLLLLMLMLLLSIFKLRKSKKAIINVGCENNDGVREASIQKVPTVIF